MSRVNMTADVTFSASNIVLQLDDTLQRLIRNKKKEEEKDEVVAHIPMAELLLRRSGPCPSELLNLGFSSLRGALRCNASGGGN